MSARWRLAVEGLGRIESADAEIRPLTLLIGENNSGKSYFATLLWGLVFTGWSLPSPEGPALEACRAWVKANAPPAVPRFDRALTEAEVEMFQRLFNEALEAGKDGKDGLLERLFRSRKVGARSIRMHAVAPASELRWTHEYDPETGHKLTRLVPTNRELLTVGPDHDRAATMATSSLRNASVLMDAAPAMLMPLRGRDRFLQGDPMFIPASRTGYMHLYREVVRQRFAAGPQVDTSGEGDLTLPAFHFLDFVAFGAKVNSPKYKEACALLESALTGHIEVADRGVNEVSYAMDGLSELLSMPLSSALVSELAPLLMVLRSAPMLRLLVLEEPESHLSPRLQRVVARAIVRLVRAGVVVVVTTHSATFCQQINNFIKLGSLPPEARSGASAQLKYEDADYLLAEEVVGHSFDIGDDGRTRVRELKRTESGIVMPPFNRELLRLSEETKHLQDLLAGMGS